MVHVEVCDQQVVDLAYPCVARGSNNPVRIAGLVRVARPESRAIARPSCVDEQRVTLGSDYERRLSSLNVDEVNLERPASLTRRRGGRSE